MRLIESKAELLPWNPGIEGVYKTIELAGRTCYKSEDKMTEDSAKAFVDRMITSNHTAMLEHGTVYLAIPITTHYSGDANVYMHSPYCVVKESIGLNFKDKFGDPVDCWCITTNLRFIHENNLWDDVKEFLCDPTEFHEMRYSFKLTTSIGVTRELNRHRVHSIAEQSTRYCNYSKDKFENEIKFVKPAWLPLNLGVYKVEKKDEGIGDIVGDGYIKEVSNEDADNQFLAACLNQEIAYMNLVTENGWHQQQAREVLPLCTATEIVHTAFAEDWGHFFDLRYFEKTGKVHPNMKELVEKMVAEAQKNGIWNDIMSQPSKFEDIFDESNVGTTVGRD